jgi:prepilin-type N-terminal cleavage/methylation domain-containing protein
MSKQYSKSFTLIELLIVLALIAILTTILIVIIKSKSIFLKTKDTQRINDLKNIEKIIDTIYATDQTFDKLNYASSNIVYISLPDNNTNCSNWLSQLPSLPLGWSYRCSATPTNINGTGWIPIPFSNFPILNISQLPIDPINKPPYYYSFVVGGGYEIIALLESDNQEFIVSNSKTRLTPINRGRLAGYFYRRQIMINNTSNSNNLTDYQILITLDTASLISSGKMRDDCGDIRFTDSIGNTLLNYWLESGCNSANTKIWVKVPLIPANSSKTIYVYYGNPSATSISNGDATFDFFDDFLGTSLNASKWDSVGDYSISNGIILINPNHVTNSGTIDGISVLDGIYSKLTFTYPIEIRTKITGHTDYVRYELGLLGLLYNYDDGGSSWWGLYFNQSRVVTWGYNVPTNDLIGDVLVRIGSTHFYLKDPTTNTPQTWAYGLNNNLNNYRIVVSSWYTSDISIDFVTVRKYTSPEPTTSVGNEERL